MNDNELFDHLKNRERKYAPIKWSNKLKIGYSVIDQHHKKLFGLVQELHDIIHSDHSDKASIERIAISLRTYTIYHFGVEERILKMYNCPLYNEHKRQHTEFISTIERCFSELISGNSNAQDKIHEFLLNWLVDHVRGSDRKWGDWIRQHYPNVLDLD